MKTNWVYTQKKHKHANRIIISEFWKHKHDKMFITVGEAWLGKGHHREGYVIQVKTYDEEFKNDRGVVVRRSNIKTIDESVAYTKKEAMFIAQKYRKKYNGYVYSNVTKLDQERVIGVLNKVMKKYATYEGKFDKSVFADVRILKNKKMDNKSGIGSFMIPKPKDSNIVVAVTYDGAGYDYFSVNATGNGIASQDVQKELDRRYKGKYHLEHYTNWAFQIYKE